MLVAGRDPSQGLLTHSSMHRHAAFRCFLLGGTALTLLAATAPAVRAETFLLKSGGRIEAQQLNPARTATEPYLLKTALGLKLALTPAQVHRVVVRSDVQKQYDAQVLEMPNTADGHWEMAEWCKEAGLRSERKRHLQAALDIEPNHEQARAALGFGRVGDRWMTMDDVMLSLGYVRAGGVWKTPQQVEIEVAKRENDLAIKRLRRDILMWIDQLSGSRRETAIENLRSLRDPRAGPTLVELVKKERPREIRLLALDMLSRLPPGLGGQDVINLAMDEKDDEIRDRCLDEVVRMKPSGVASVFVAELKSEKNWRVNRAATCLARLDDLDSTLPLIDALVTTHKYLIMPNGGGGGIGFNSAGGFSVGGRPQEKKQEHTNESVLAALRTLHPGANFGHDEAAWRKWYVEKFTTTKVDLRRDE